MLKIAGLVIDGGYVFEYDPQPAKKSWAQETLNFPGGRADTGDITGSVEEKKKEEPPKPEAPAVEMAKPAGLVTIPPEGQAPVSASERAILERLQSRRLELEARAREIDIRESLLKAAEKKMESRVEELKGAESKVATASEQKNEAEAARFKGIITMYESMKPKDAAKVFDRLEMPVLYQIASQIAPRKMSDILGLMSPEVAERPDYRNGPPRQLRSLHLRRRTSQDRRQDADAKSQLARIFNKALNR